MTNAPPRLIYSDTPDGEQMVWEDEFLEQVVGFPVEAAKSAYRHVTWEPDPQLIADAQGWERTLMVVFANAATLATNRAQKAHLARWFPQFASEYRDALTRAYEAVSKVPLPEDVSPTQLALSHTLRRRKKEMREAKEKAQSFPRIALGTVATDLFDLAPQDDQVALIFDAGIGMITEYIAVLDNPKLSRHGKAAVSGQVIGVVVRAKMWEAQRLLISFVLGMGQFVPPLIDERHPLMKRYRREVFDGK